MTSVTFFVNQNVYTYSASILWLAYGLAIGAAALSTMAGSVTAVRAGGTFRTKFSTIVRVISHAHLSRPVGLTDASGQEPVSTRAAKTIVYFPVDRAGEKQAWSGVQQVPMKVVDDREQDQSEFPMENEKDSQEEYSALRYDPARYSAAW
jgi:hypothetical protein